MKTIESLLAPENLRSVQGLELLARTTLQGMAVGQNPGKRLGAGQNLSQYRAYQPGDDIRLLDWKMYARSDKFFVREAELETNLSVRFILDASASMLHKDNNYTKIDYAKYLIATVAWLAQSQGDKLGLNILNENLFLEIQPRAGKRNFRKFLYELVQINPEASFRNSENAFYKNTRSKELIFYISDLYENNTEHFDFLKQLQSPRREIVVLHLLGENEKDFDFGDYSTFEDLETGERIQVDVSNYKKIYLENFNKNIDKIKSGLTELGMYYESVNMRLPVYEVVRMYLKKRMQG